MTGRLLLLALLLFTASRPIATAQVSHMVNVNGASLEYVDWGGDGPPMVFLAGLSDTPYIYAELATEFTSRFHCYGLTRRGHGGSEKSAEGYTLEAMVDDVAAFLRTLDLTGVTLVGHSYGGTEVVRFAQRYPGLVTRAVVLDIAYASPQGVIDIPYRLLDKLGALVMAPQERLTSLDNYRTFLTWLHRSWSSASEANLREQVDIGADGRVTARMTPAIGAQFDADQSNWFLTTMPVPALFIFSNNPFADLAQGLAVDAEVMKAIDAADVLREAPAARANRNHPTRLAASEDCGTGTYGASQLHSQARRDDRGDVGVSALNRRVMSVFGVSRHARRRQR